MFDSSEPSTSISLEKLRKDLQREGISLVELGKKIKIELTIPNLSDQDRQDLEAIFSELASILQRDIITDPFKDDHDARRTWRKKYLDNPQIEPIFRQIYENNRLRMNSIDIVLRSISVLPIIITMLEQTPQLENIKEISQSIGEEILEKAANQEEYDKLDDDEKITFIRSVSKKIERMLEIASGRDPH